MPKPSNIPQVVVYSRQGCHLCDDVCLALEQLDVTPNVVDVDQHPELQHEYDQCVPVVEINGKVRFRGRVNLALLRRQIDAEKSHANRATDTEPNR